MGHEFELSEEISLDATPDQVWAAIASGPGIDSWFMGRNEVAGHEGGRNAMSLFGFDNASTTTAWEPGKRYAIRTDEGPNGTFMAFEYLIEGREGGSTVLRYVHHGMLGDDWEAEYDGLRKGTRMYLEKLAQYLRHFEGQIATYNSFLVGPVVADKQAVWASFRDVFGVDTVPGPRAPGDRRTSAGRRSLRLRGRADLPRSPYGRRHVRADPRPPGQRGRAVPRLRQRPRREGCRSSMAAMDVGDVRMNDDFLDAVYRV